MLQKKSLNLILTKEITPPVPRGDFWTNPETFNFQRDPMLDFPGAKLLGRLPSKKSIEVKKSILGIGFETLDRKTFDPMKTVPFLAESGIKFARCQTGWLRCEKEVGKYDFSWLDEIVDSLAKIGIEVWFSLGFGHPVHTPVPKYDKIWKEAKGKAEHCIPGPARGWVGEVPIYHGEKSVKAWQAYVRALCKHFRGRVRYFEIWNEPDMSNFWQFQGIPKHLTMKERARDYSDFVRMTAGVVRKEIPEAKIIADAAQTGTNFIKYLGENKLADVIDIFSYHFYGPVPEQFMRERVENLRAVLRPSDPGKKISIWQGESGRATGKSVLYSFPSEFAQAKYLTRRYLIDLVCGVELSSIFTVTDLLSYYPDGTTSYYGVINTKDNCGKLAYYALQGMGWLFDGLKNAPDNLCAFLPDHASSFEPRAPYRIEAHSFRRNGKPIFAFWNPEHVEITAPATHGQISILTDDSEKIKQPVLIDPIRRNVWTLKPKLMQPSAEGTFRIYHFPITDYPVFIADASILENR